MDSPDDLAPENDRDDNTQERKTSAAVRYGKMNNIGEFSYPPGMQLNRDAKMVISTDRGIEIGKCTGLTYADGEQSVFRDHIDAYVRASGEESYHLNKGNILRQATETDLAELRHIEEGELDKLETCRRFARELGLNMKVVACEHILGGERIVLYFMAEERVDFRDLVRKLATEFQTRIEMRQIGARDEARLLADYETCGRQCCCKNFLKTLKPVSMTMAKLQKTTLDLSKVSGRCGRLKCCLRYENENYENLDKQLPRVGKLVATTIGTGCIVDRQILTQLVKIKFDDGRIVSVAVEDILDADVPEPPPEPDGGEINKEDESLPADLKTQSSPEEFLPRDELDEDTTIAPPTTIDQAAEPGDASSTNLEGPAEQVSEPGEQAADPTEQVADPGDGGGRSRRSKGRRRKKRRRRPRGRH